MIISQMLKEKRKEYQLTQEQLAEKIFVSNKTISNWETNKTKPDIESLILLAKLFDLSLDNLLLEGSDMVKSINTDIKKGRNLKKILSICLLPFVLVSIFFAWATYQDNNRRIVPYEEMTRIEITTGELSARTQIQGELELENLESFDFLSTTTVDGVIYLMVYTEPHLFSRETSFDLNLQELLEINATTNENSKLAEINKIVLTSFDRKQYDGYSGEQLTKEFPQRVLWEK